MLRTEKSKVFSDFLVRGRECNSSCCRNSSANWLIEAGHLRVGYGEIRISSGRCGIVDSFLDPDECFFLPFSIEKWHIDVKQTQEGTCLVVPSDFPTGCPLQSLRSTE
ncbi:hypothetical protein M3J09_010635 [Ascochyta lentis]